MKRHSLETGYVIVLLALMTILAQSLLTLVSSHLVTLFFLSVWHSCIYFIKVLILLVLS